MRIFKLVLIVLLLSYCFSIAAFQDDNATSFAQKTIKEVISIVENHYLYNDNSNEIAAHLNTLASTFTKKPNENLTTFTEQLNKTLRNVSGDKYLEVKVDYPVNIGFSKMPSQIEGQIEVMSTNIGYFKLLHFYYDAQSITAIEQAFSDLQQTDALIIDLTNVDNGDFNLALHLLAYFLPTNDLVGTLQTQTQPHQPILINTKQKIKYNKPVYVLTSPFNEGATELFIYTLKHFDKAVVIGKPTMGIAHFLEEIKLNDNLTLKLPVSLPFHPITNSNWEDAGVIPDYEIAIEQSLSLALQLANNHL